jgi:hypothetical protein
MLSDIRGMTPRTIETPAHTFQALEEGAGPLVLCLHSAAQLVRTGPAPPVQTWLTVVRSEYLAPVVGNGRIAQARNSWTPPPPGGGEHLGGRP